MYVRIIFTLLLALPAIGQAETKRIECGQVTDKTVSQSLFVTIDGTSDKAEVQLYAHSSACAATNSCLVLVYQKEVLPTVIRLYRSSSVGNLSYTTTIDINRSSLGVTTRTVVSGDGETTETVAHGQCAASVIRTKNLI